MRRALALAEHGRGTVSPNPLVGCVIVRDGVAVGEGFHARAGEAHAEIAALGEAGRHAAGSTVYVTLEPCAHRGRTGPCTNALLDAGVRRVVAALAEPNAEAAGGAEQLRAAGIDVDVGVCADAAARQNEVFVHSVTRGRPFVIAKAAVSLDGRIAAADGTSQWLTGEATRGRAHALRAEVDAVLVGSGTVLADDPSLTVRGVDYRGSPPLRVVVDRRGRVAPAARMLDDRAPSLVLATDVAGTLAELWQRQVRSVLLEGGATLLSAFLTAGCVDKLVLHTAPVLLGAAGRPVVEDGPATLDDAARWCLDTLERVGDDVIAVYYPKGR